MSVQIKDIGVPVMSVVTNGKILRSKVGPDMINIGKTLVALLPIKHSTDTVRHDNTIRQYSAL